MRYFESRLRSAKEALELYTYPQPFHLHIKSFFRANKKFGSKDRKAIQSICYTYWRTAHWFADHTLEDALFRSSLFLLTDDASVWVNAAIERGILEGPVAVQTRDEKIQATGAKHSEERFPAERLMPQFSGFNAAELVDFRPSNWVKDHKDDTAQHLGLPGCKMLDDNELTTYHQIQDLSSQQICNSIEIVEEENVWDVCAGAGGKSLNLMNGGKGRFYLSDIRPAILKNARKRINDMHYAARFGALDIAEPLETLRFGSETVHAPYFDRIIADVPCSGSGTWFRTPEHFTRFDYKTLEQYSQRQKNIIKNAMDFLKPGGVFYYITCSVFDVENEQVTAWALENLTLEMVEESVVNGCDNACDSMYMVALRKRY